MGWPSIRVNEDIQHFRQGASSYVSEKIELIITGE
jgi:hypothetical protein